MMSHGLVCREVQFFRVASRENRLAQPLACAACDPRIWLGVRSLTVCTRAGGLGDVGLLTPGVGHARSVATNVSEKWA